MYVYCCWARLMERLRTKENDESSTDTALRVQLFRHHQATTKVASVIETTKEDSKVAIQHSRHGDFYADVTSQRTYVPSK